MKLAAIAEAHHRDLPRRAGARSTQAWLRGALRLTPQAAKGAVVLAAAFQIEKSFRMSKHDLKARPIYHHKRESIDAHLTIVFPTAAGDSVPAMVPGIGIWLSAMAAGLGYTLLGIAVLRTGLWRGWQAGVPLLCGLFVFVVVFPVSLLAPALFHWRLAGWALCFALLGAALYREPSPLPAEPALT